MMHRRSSATALMLLAGPLACAVPSTEDPSAEPRAPRTPEPAPVEPSAPVSGRPRAAGPSEARLARQVWRRWQQTSVLPAALPEPARGALQALSASDAGTRSVAQDAGAALDGGRAEDAADAAPSGESTVHPGAEVPTEPVPALDADIVARSELPFHGVVRGERVSARDVWRLLRRSRAICLGEQHDDPFHHNLQVRVLERLAALQRAFPDRRGELAVGYEMFQRPFQAPLEAYVSGELSEAEFLAQTEYAQRWGADLALYRPLFEANRAQGLAALALNAPTELTRQIGREGLESLSIELAALLPELVLDDAEHRQFIFGLFGLTPEDPSAASLENIYRAQTTWDETMAQTASEWLAGDAERRVLAFAGSAHCHESAIPRRLERRTGIDMLSVSPAFASEVDAAPDAWQGYELLIVLED